MSDLHPDDEALSAHLDGAHLEGARLDHLGGCAACESRLAELRRVRAVVGTPVPAPAAWQRDRLIARALEAHDERRGERRRFAPWAGGIAAGLLLVLGAAFGLSQLAGSSHRNDANSVASGSAGAKSSKALESRPGPAPAELGDLGELGGAGALRAVVQPKVTEFAARAPGAPAPAAPAGHEQDTVTAQERALDTPSTRADAKGPAGCEDAARTLDPANLRPTAVGTATWLGTPAEVLVYTVEARRGAARVYVLARDDCRVLAFQSYAP